MVFALAFQHTLHPAEAEDVAQETFLRAFRDLARLRDPNRFPAWLYGIALNVIREFSRGRDTAVPLDFAPEPAAEAPDLEERHRQEAVLAGVARLPEKYRIPLTLHYVDGLPYSEIGLTLDMPETTARSLVHRAREMLAVILSSRPE